MGKYYDMLLEDVRMREGLHAYIRVVLQMNRQMNFADFTGIYLYPEAFGTQYIYEIGRAHV